MTRDQRPRFRLNLVRAIRLHWGLALAPALADLVLAALYTAKWWPLLGARVLPIASLLALGGIAVGVLAAAVAYRLDPNSIEPGVTTRRQLRGVIETLQQLGPGAVRFVLNRTAPAKADPGFRRSLNDMEKHLRSQGISSSMWPVRSRGFRDEPTRQPGGDAARAESEPVQEIIDGRLPFAVFRWPGDADTETPPAPQSPTPVEEPQPFRSTDTTQPPEVDQACGPIAPDPALALKFEPPTLPDWFWGERSAERNEPVKPTEALKEKSDLPQAVPAPASRLSALRGAISALGLKDLSRRKAGDWYVNEPSGAPEPEKGANTAIEPAPETVSDQPGAECPAAPPSEEPAAAEPQIPPREFVPVVDSRRASAGLDSDIDDSIRILPAKRGQYTSR